MDESISYDVYRWEQKIGRLIRKSITSSEGLLKMDCESQSVKVDCYNMGQTALWIHQNYPGNGVLSLRQMNGDKTKLYQVSDGNLEVFTLIAFEIQDGASAPTYHVMKQDGTKSVISPDMYSRTVIEAWQEYVDDLESAIEYNTDKVAELIADVQTWRANLKTAKEQLN